MDASFPLREPSPAKDDPPDAVDQSLFGLRPAPVHPLQNILDAILKSLKEKPGRGARRFFWGLFLSCLVLFPVLAIFGSIAVLAGSGDPIYPRLIGFGAILLTVCLPPVGAYILGFLFLLAFAVDKYTRS